MVKFKLMSAADKPAFRQLNIDALMVALQGYARRNQAEVLQFAERQIDHDIAQAENSSEEKILTIVNDIDGQKIGTLWYRLHSEPIYVDLVFICWISIHSKFRRQGFAKAALNQLAVELSVNGISRMALQAYNNNIASIKLYESLGFEAKRTIMHKYLTKN